MSKITDMQEYVAELSNPNVLKLLVQICEDPGDVKSHYVLGSKTAFYAVDKLKDMGLVEEIADDGARALHPTEAGRSLYTGIWYAAGRGALVPALRSFHALVPPAFWLLDTFTLSKREEGMVLVSSAGGDELLIESPHITPDGDLWFSVKGAPGRLSLDVEEDIDTLDVGTQECIKEIVAESRRKEAEKAERNYNDLVDFSTDV